MLFFSGGGKADNALGLFEIKPETRVSLFHVKGRGIYKCKDTN